MGKGYDCRPVITFRFSRIMFDVSSSPFLLNATLQDHKYAEPQPTVVEKLLKSIYVDDVVDTEEQAHQFYKGAKQLLTGGSFNLWKFVSNLPSLRVKTGPSGPNTLPPNIAEPLNETYAGASLPGSTTHRHGEHKILGVSWNIRHDSLIFDFGHCC